jgi:beta-1,2-mannobiose phosphorylase / 1,2-beta-oligomannan phosphorylase
MATTLKKKIIKKITKPSIKKKKVVLAKKNTTIKKTTKINKKKTTKKKISTKIKKISLSKKKIVKKKIKKKGVNKLELKRAPQNPIMSPRPYSWESRAVFNPGAILSDGRVHLFYRALGDDGVSRLGYASSRDGINFEDRLFYPVYFLKETELTKNNWAFTSPMFPAYNTSVYGSGGGWGGCEDPRAVLIDGNIYLTINIFDASNGWKWDSMRVAVVSIKEENLLNKKWIWENFSYLSLLGDRQKNWVLFPEKINGKFVLFHNLDKGDPDRVFISYVNKLDTSETPTVKDAPDPQVLPDHIVAWHKRTRSAASPPIKTKDGWLLLYHAMDKEDDNRYKLGAMLLDLKDPSKVLYRAQRPILEPDEWYENDWKPGIIYANGSVVIGENLFVYYGGGDKYIGVASIKVLDLIRGLKENKVVKLAKTKKVKTK